MKFLFLAVLTLFLGLLMFQPPGIMAQVDDTEFSYCLAAPVLPAILVVNAPVFYTMRSLPGPLLSRGVPEVAHTRCTSFAEPLLTNAPTYPLRV